MKRLQIMMHIREEIVYCGNTKYHMREYQKENKQIFFLEWAEKETKREGRKSLRQTLTLAHRSLSFQKVKEYSRSSHSGEVIKPLIFIIEMKKKKTLVSLVKPSDQNHKRYVDITADGNINDIQTVKMKSSHHTYKPGLVCFWCVAESCWETTDGRWKRGFYHTNTHCFPQTCCSSTLRTNLLRSLQDINSHLNVKLQLCVMKFQKGYGPIVQSFLHRKSCTKVEYTCWCIQKSSEKETVHLQVFSATDSHNTGFPLLLQSAEALRLSGSATCRQELSGKLRHPISHHHHSQHMITGTHKVCQKTKKGQLDEQ